MKQVMISELKAHLSEVLRAVKAGETYVVRDRGVPVAQVVPYVEEDEVDIIEPTLPRPPFVTGEAMNLNSRGWP